MKVSYLKSWQWLFILKKKEDSRILRQLVVILNRKDKKLLFKIKKDSFMHYIKIIFHMFMHKCRSVIKPLRNLLPHDVAPPERVSANIEKR